MLDTLKPKNIFLLDGLGAAFSTLMHGVVLVWLEDAIGMPSQILYPLAFVAFLFFIYSISCYLFFSKNWRRLLKIIASANLLFCAVSFVLVVLFYKELTNLGLFYFIAEIFVVVPLAIYELKVAGR